MSIQFLFTSCFLINHTKTGRREGRTIWEFRKIIKGRGCVSHFLLYLHEDTHTSNRTSAEIKEGAIYDYI